MKTDIWRESNMTEFPYIREKMKNLIRSGYFCEKGEPKEVPCAGEGQFLYPDLDYTQKSRTLWDAAEASVVRNDSACQAVVVGDKLPAVFHEATEFVYNGKIYQGTVGEMICE